MHLKYVVMVLGATVACFFTVAVLVGFTNVAVSVAAGAFTGLCETLLMYPLENIKVQQQLHRGALKEVVLRTLSVHGCRGLYWGIFPVLVGAIPTQAIRWGVFEGYCGLQVGAVCRSIGQIFVAALLAGAAVSLIIGVLIETIKTEQIHRQSASTRKLLEHQERSEEQLTRTVIVSPLASSRKIHHNGGVLAGGQRNLQLPNDEVFNLTRSPQTPMIRTFDELEGLDCTKSELAVMPRLILDGSVETVGAAVGEEAVGISHHLTDDDTGTSASSSFCRLSCKGWLPTVLKKVTNQAVRFPMHHIALSSLCTMMVASKTVNTDCRAADHFVLSLLAGAAAGLSSIVVTQPVDVVKTRMQGLNAHRYKHMLHCWRTMIEEDGFMSLFDGMAARALRSALGAALTFTVFPQVKWYILEAWGLHTSDSR